MKTTTAVLALCCLSLLSGSALAKIRVDPVSKSLVDSAGHTYLFHGVNVGYKVAPFAPPNIDTFNYDNSFCDVDAQNLRNWGVNFVRLTFYWEAVEPVRGQFDLAYLARLRQITDLCQKYGIYVLLDLHQDVASRKTCGEGMPDWAVKDYDTLLTKFPAPMYNLKIEYGPDGYPTKESCLENLFASYYNTYAVQDSYQRLYTNEDGIGDEFRKMWKLVASKFVDAENVIGYEIINEPYVGNTFQHPGILIKDQFLLPFYQSVNAAIREVDQETIIFYEYPLTDYLLRSFHGTPGGPEYADRQILSFHVYGLPEGDPTDAFATDFACGFLYDRSISFMKSENIAGFLTEFGAISGQTSPGLQNIQYVLNKADENLHSWAYWQFKYYEDYTTAARPSKWEGFYDDQGNLIKAKVAEMARPFIQKSSLKIVSMKFEPLLKEFHATLAKTANSPSTHVELYINEEFHFTDGVTCKLGNCPGCRFGRVLGESKHRFFLDHTASPQGELKISCFQIRSI